MKKLFIVFLFPIALFSCSKSNDVKPLALVDNTCNQEPQYVGKIIKIKNANSIDSTSLTYDSKGVLVSGHNAKLSTDNTFIYYSSCYIDSVVIKNLSAPGESYYKVVKRDGNLPTKINLYSRNSPGGTLITNDSKELFYSSDKKTLIYNKWSTGNIYQANIPSVTNTDLFFVVLF